MKDTILGLGLWMVECWLANVVVTIWLECFRFWLENLRCTHHWSC